MVTSCHITWQRPTKSPVHKPELAVTKILLTIVVYFKIKKLANQNTEQIILFFKKQTRIVVNSEILMADDPGWVNHYEVLGVPRDASTKVLTKVYRKLALRFHPDKADKKNILQVL